jgi:Fe2+ transport system protein FeoA
MPAEFRNGSPAALSAVPLTELRAGDSGALHTCDLLDGDRQLLSALGLADRAKFRLCKAGSPWIVQVRGTRIGIAEAVARKIQVLPNSSR